MRKHTPSRRKLLRRMRASERGAIPLEYLIIATAGLAIAAFVAFQMKRWLCLQSLPKMDEGSVDPAFGCADDLADIMRRCYQNGRTTGRDFTCTRIRMPNKCEDAWDGDAGELSKKIKPLPDENKLGFKVQSAVSNDPADGYAGLDCQDDTSGATKDACKTIYVSYDYSGEATDPNILIGDSRAELIPSC